MAEPVTDLVEFLRQRLAEDRAWADNPECDQDPARVLREVEAKRKVLNAYTAQVAEVQRISVLRDAEVAKAGEDSLTVAELIGTGLRVGSWINPLEWVLRIMATVYADHPDYREDWKP